MRVLITTIVYIICSINVYAQDSTYQNIQAPEFAFEPMVVHADFTTTPLPKENGLVSMWGKAKKMTNELIIDKPHASFIVKGNALKIVVKNGMLMGTVSNPRDRNKLYKLTADEKKKRRTCVVAEFDRGPTGKITGNNTDFDIALTFVKIKEDVYLVTIQNLEPGEYAWQAGLGFFTFKVE